LKLTTKTQWRTIAITAVAFALSPIHLHASAITVPTGLNPGDTYRIVFVTSDTRDATSTNIDDYNTFVTAAANRDAGLAALASRWYALASTPSVDAYQNAAIFSPIPIYNTAGQLVSPGYIYLPSSLPFLHAIWYTETGEETTTVVWTGTNPDGTRAITSIRGWGPLGTTFVQYGMNSTLIERWTVASNQISSGPSTDLNPFYGISEVLTVPQPTPEPATSAMIGIGALFAMGYGRMRRLRN
jgi:hypothetical protein